MQNLRQMNEFRQDKRLKGLSLRLFFLLEKVLIEVQKTTELSHFRNEIGFWNYLSSHSFAQMV